MGHNSIWSLVTECQGGVWRNLATVKGFWMFSDQKLIQNQTHNESKVFLAAFLHIVSCNHGSLGSEHLTGALCTAHTEVPCNANESCRAQDLVTYGICTEHTFSNFYKTMVTSLWKSKTFNSSRPPFLSIKFQVSTALEVGSVAHRKPSVQFQDHYV